MHAAWPEGRYSKMLHQEEPSYPNILSVPWSRGRYIHKSLYWQKMDLCLLLWNIYFMSALASDGKFLLAARKCMNLTCTDYLISLHRSDISKRSSTYIGKLRLSFHISFCIQPIILSWILCYRCHHQCFVVLFLHRTNCSCYPTPRYSYFHPQINKLQNYFDTTKPTTNSLYR